MTSYGSYGHFDKKRNIHKIFDSAPITNVSDKNNFANYNDKINITTSKGSFIEKLHRLGDNLRGYIDKNIDERYNEIEEVSKNSSDRMRNFSFGENSATSNFNYSSKPKQNHQVAKNRVTFSPTLKPPVIETKSPSRKKLNSNNYREVSERRKREYNDKSLSRSFSKERSSGSKSPKKHKKHVSQNAQTSQSRPIKKPSELLSYSPFMKKLQEINKDYSLEKSYSPNKFKKAKKNLAYDPPTSRAKEDDVDLDELDELDQLDDEKKIERAGEIEFIKPQQRSVNSESIFMYSNKVLNIDDLLNKFSMNSKVKERLVAIKEDFLNFTSSYFKRLNLSKERTSSIHNAIYRFFNRFKNFTHSKSSELFKVKKHYEDIIRDQRRNYDENFHNLENDKVDCLKILKDSYDKNLKKLDDEKNKQINTLIKTYEDKLKSQEIEFSERLKIRLKEQKEKDKEESSIGFEKLRKELEKAKEEECEKLNEVLSNLRGELVKKLNEIDDLQRTLKKKEEEINQLKNELAANSQYLSEKEKEALNLLKSNEDKISVEFFLKISKEKEREIMRLKRTIDAFEVDRTGYLEALSEKDKEIYHLKRNSNDSYKLMEEDYKNQIAVLTAKYEEQIKSIVKKNQTQMSSITNERKREMMSILKYKENENEYNLEKMEKLQKQIADLESAIKDKNDTMDKILKDNHDKENTIKKLSARYTTLTKIKDVNSWVDDK